MSTYRSSSVATVALAWLAVLSVASGDALEGLKVGGILKVKAEEAALKVGKEVVGTVTKGQILQAKKLNGSWIWTETQVEGTTKRGWIHAKYVEVPTAVRKPRPLTEPEPRVKKPRPSSRPTPEPEVTEDERTTEPKVIRMRGTFVWSSQRGREHDLQVVFTQKTGREWDGVWTFKWNKRDTTYRGTATIANGRMTGTAAPDNHARNFGFEATLRGSRASGTHYEFKGDRRVPTGDFSMTGTR